MIRRIRSELLICVAVFLLSACSKTVTWEEEVPLNTGESIWVTRSVNYSLQGGAGNPLDIAYRPESVELLKFEWNGKKYEYKGDAGVILLAISPRKQPVLVAPAADSGWNFKNDYKCTVPFYVQLMPDINGNAWTWPPAIEPWLFGLKYNLMRTRNSPSEMKNKITIEMRAALDKMGSVQAPSRAQINATEKAEFCK